MRRVLRRLVSEGGRRRVRRLGRIRWITKLAVLRRYGQPPLSWLAYLLTDPEVDSFTYRIANRDELGRFLAERLDEPLPAIERYLGEIDGDPVLRGALRQPVAHWLWCKREPEPRAYHQACWAVIRAKRPAHVVETGILDGMCSIAMLAALKRNAAEGAPGTLHSFDIMPKAGSMVPASLRTHWGPITGDAVHELHRVVGTERVGFLASDSLRDTGQIRAELDAVLQHRGASVVALTTSGDLDDLAWPASVHRFKEEPLDHFFAGSTFAMARFDEEAEPQPREPDEPRLAR